MIRFQRANFLVRNIDKAMRFYGDVLGFELAFVKESEEDSYSYTVFDIGREQTMRFATLSTPTQARVMALTEVPNLKPPAMPRRSAIVLEVPDIDATVARARAAGFGVYDEEVLRTHDGRTGQEVGLVDEDGNLVVIYYIPSAEDKR